LEKRGCLLLSRDLTAAEHPERQLAHFSGALQVDAYAGCAAAPILHGKPRGSSAKRWRGRLFRCGTMASLARNRMRGTEDADV